MRQGDFGRFTESARRVADPAREEASALKHDVVGSEHILLGLLRERDGVAALVLGSLNVTVERVRAAVVQRGGAGDGDAPGQLQFTPGAREVLDRLSRFVGSESAGSVVQFADCGDWRAGTRAQRLVTIERLRGQLTPQRSETADSPLSDERAYELLAKACSPAYRQPPALQAVRADAGLRSAQRVARLVHPPSNVPSGHGLLRPHSGVREH